MEDWKFLVDRSNEEARREEQSLLTFDVHTQYVMHGYSVCSYFFTLPDDNWSSYSVKTSAKVFDCKWVSENLLFYLAM